MRPVYRYDQKTKKKFPWGVIFALVLIITACGYIYLFDWAGLIDLPYVDDNGSSITDPNN